MKFNTDRSFVGLEKLKQTHQEQIARFEDWASRQAWDRFHSSHYDWWTFPIDRSSAYGLTWTVYEGEVAALKQDAGFIQRYLRGVTLVSAAWGWDVNAAARLPHPHPDQRWQHWPVRLFKAARSVQLFGYESLFASLKTYALDLLRQGEGFSYNGHDLSWLFTGGKDPRIL